jgi:hypothetical protein
VRTIGQIYFPTRKLCIYYDEKWFGLHFGRLFSQTHPVTLNAADSVDAGARRRRARVRNTNLAPIFSFLFLFFLGSPPRMGPRPRCQARAGSLCQTDGSVNSHRTALVQNGDIRVFMSLHVAAYGFQLTHNMV